MDAAHSALREYVSEPVERTDRGILVVVVVLVVLLVVTMPLRSYGCVIVFPFQLGAVCTHIAGSLHCTNRTRVDAASRQFASRRAGTPGATTL